MPVGGGSPALGANPCTGACGAWQALAQQDRHVLARDHSEPGVIIVTSSAFLACKRLWLSRYRVSARFFAQSPPEMVPTKHDTDDLRLTVDISEDRSVSFIADGDCYYGGVQVHLSKCRLTYVEFTLDAAFCTMTEKWNGTQWHAMIQIGICDDFVAFNERDISGQRYLESGYQVPTGSTAGDTVGVLYDREAHTVSHFRNGALRPESGAQVSARIPRSDRVRIALMCMCSSKCPDGRFAVQVAHRPPPADYSRRGS